MECRVSVGCQWGVEMSVGHLWGVGCLSNMWVSVKCGVSLGYGVYGALMLVMFMSFLTQKQ